MSHQGWCYYLRSHVILSYAVAHFTKHGIIRHARNFKAQSLKEIVGIGHTRDVPTTQARKITKRTLMPGMSELMLVGKSLMLLRSVS